MLETIEKQKQRIPQCQSRQTKFRISYRKGQPSHHREFNDPIYAGFQDSDCKNQDKWSPWMPDEDSLLKQRYSQTFYTKANNVELRTGHSRAMSKKSNDMGFAFKGRLPDIKENVKCKVGERNTRHDREASYDHNWKEKEKLKKMEHEIHRRIQQQNKDRLKLGIIIYNYCTNREANQAKKERNSQQSLLSKNMFMNDALKAFWNKKSKSFKFKFKFS